MKKILVFLCVVFMIIGAVGCKSSSSTGNISDSITSVTTQTDDVTGDVTGVGDTASHVPEPATILLLGSALMGLAGVGRKKFFNKDQGKG
ncbi:MAG: PEP-CTERM sorting domain-containing protein [Thermodesulfobacteriota bacterium]|nr:PEP-CTERM sorting domain-containing protein [Thermodesulfobacteriota bacterium]